MVILDIPMPGLRGIEAAREIKVRWPNTRILMLSMHKSEEFLAMALEAGSDGYLLKDDSGDELIKAISQLRAGRTFVHVPGQQPFQGYHRHLPGAPRRIRRSIKRQGVPGVEADRRGLHRPPNRRAAVYQPANRPASSLQYSHQAEPQAYRRSGQICHCQGIYQRMN
jgi:hypothetical protein